MSHKLSKHAICREISRESLRAWVSVGIGSGKGVIGASRTIKITCLKAALIQGHNDNNNNCRYFWSILIICCHHSVVLLLIESFSHLPYLSRKTSDYFIFWSFTSCSGCKPHHHAYVSVPGLAECLQQGRRIDESEFEAGEGPQRARVNRVSLVSDADTSMNLLTAQSIRTEL